MMTEEEFRADLLAGAASRAESVSSGFREAFTDEVLDRLREAGELPDTERCTEALTGRNGRKLEVDAFVFDDADDSLHLFVAILDGGGSMPPVLTLTEAREQGFNRLLGVFEQAATDGLWRISKKAILCGRWLDAFRGKGDGRRYGFMSSATVASVSAYGKYPQT